jgi:hypothetical protein
MQHKSFLPLRGILLLPINGKGVMAFACNNDFGKPEIMEPLGRSYVLGEGWRCT